MQRSDNSEQPVLVIVGMHRSGTSLTASLLQSAGLDIGQHLVEGNFSNVKGHFENVDFFSFHRDVLAALGLNDGWTVEKTIYVPESYVDQAQQLIEKSASSTQPWGWKDPRTSLFLDFWHHLLPKAKFLLIYRSPWEVLDSLYRRGDITFHRNPEFALKIWMHYNQRILDFYQRFPEKCVLTHLQRVIENPPAFIELLNQRLNIPLSAPAADIYDGSLLKREPSSSHREVLIQRHFPEAYALYEQLNHATDLGQAAAPLQQELLSPTAWLLQDWMDLRLLQKKMHDTVVHLENQLCFKETDLARVSQANQLLQEEHRTLQAENHLLHQEIEALLESKNQLKDQLQYQHAVIEAMKTSKFWQLRSQWFKLKALFHRKV
ncbi:MAG: sulfotransferase [Leptolyngbya sp. BL-A-14]